MDLIKKNYGKIANILLALSAATMVAMVCYFLRNTVLACHDSMLDFTDARLYDFKYFYDHAMEFCLARGRAGFIFPFVVAVRQLIDGTGNYLAIWLVQQVPIWFDVGLIAWIIARKTKPYYGFYFVCFYAAYIQIDFNHSLMVCYPMDFTYGLALMIFGLYLYDGWLRNLGSSKKTNVIRLIVSLICFYESMETYEPFITAAIIYILLSAIHTYKHRSEYGRKSILKFILHLLPHGIVGIIYVGIMVYLKIKPVSDVPVTQPYSVGDFGAFVTTWKTFTVSLLPLTHYQNAGVHVRTIFTGFYTIVFAFVMAFATVMLYLCVLADYRKKDKEDRKSINKKLALLGLIGLIVALTYSIPHAMTANYQHWVLDLGATGYVPSSICYYGWALALTCLGCLIVNYFSTRKPWLYIPAYAVAAALLGTAAAVTSDINHFYREIPGATGEQISYRAQAFFSCFNSEYVKDSPAEVIYVPEYWGIHGIIGTNDNYADNELGKDVTLINDGTVLKDTFDIDNTYAAFRYNEPADAGYYTIIDNMYMPEWQWVTTSDIIFVSSYPADYEIIYYDSETREKVSTIIEADRASTYVIENDNKVKVGSIEIYQLP